MHLAKTTLAALWKNEDGVTVIEYGLVAALIAIAATATIPALATKLSGVFTTIAGSLP